MRRRLLEALTYPRLFVLDGIGRQECLHDSLFDSCSDHCHDCDLRQECHWLSCLNNFAEFANKPDHTMHASLLYSIKMVQARSDESQHDVNACDCEPCTWTRSAQQLSREFSEQFSGPAGQYRIAH